MSQPAPQITPQTSVAALVQQRAAARTLFSPPPPFQRSHSGETPAAKRHGVDLDNKLRDMEATLTNTINSAIAEVKAGQDALLNFLAGQLGEMRSEIGQLRDNIAASVQQEVANQLPGAVQQQVAQQLPACVQQEVAKQLPGAVQQQLTQQLPTCIQQEVAKQVQQLPPTQAHTRSSEMERDMLSLKQQVAQFSDKLDAAPSNTLYVRIVNPELYKQQYPHYNGKLPTSTPAIALLVGGSAAAHYKCTERSDTSAVLECMNVQDYRQILYSSNTGNRAGLMVRENLSVPQLKRKQEMKPVYDMVKALGRRLTWRADKVAFRAANGRWCSISTALKPAPLPDGATAEQQALHLRDSVAELVRQLEQQAMQATPPRQRRSAGSPQRRHTSTTSQHNSSSPPRDPRPRPDRPPPPTTGGNDTTLPPPPPNPPPPPGATPAAGTAAPPPPQAPPPRGNRQGQAQVAPPQGPRRPQGRAASRHRRPMQLPSLHWESKHYAAPGRPRLPSPPGPLPHSRRPPTPPPSQWSLLTVWTWMRGTPQHPPASRAPQLWQAQAPAAAHPHPTPPPWTSTRRPPHHPRARMTRPFQYSPSCTGTAMGCQLTR